MSRRHTVAQGETIDSIAETYGMAPDILWYDPANDALRAVRGDRNVLYVGDEVIVPEPRPSSVRIATGHRHVFKRIGVPSLYRLQLCLNGEPRGGVAWSIEAGGQRIAGTTGASGEVEFYLHPRHRRALLSVDDGPPRELMLGFLDPIDTCSGVQQRLQNLGIECPQSGEYDDGTQRALRTYQQQQDLPETGATDEATLRALARAHGPRGA